MPYGRSLAILCTLSLFACKGTAGSSGDPHPVAVLNTSFGEITIVLDREKAPRTVDNFLHYANEHFYDGTIFHRVDPAYTIQGGGYTAGGVEKPTHDPIKNESDNGLKNVRGTIGIARKADPGSATAQFYINVVDNPSLDYPNNGGYTVFGKVVVGFDVIERIQAVPTQTAGHMQKMPVNPIVIESVTLK